MAVNSLIAAANGLAIGKGLVHGFIGLVGGMGLTGGLKRYTINKEIK